MEMGTTTTRKVYLIHKKRNRGKRGKSRKKEQKDLHRNRESVLDLAYEIYSKNPSYDECVVMLAETQLQVKQGK